MARPRLADKVLERSNRIRDMLTNAITNVDPMTCMFLQEIRNEIDLLRDLCYTRPAETHWETPEPVSLDALAAAFQAPVQPTMVPRPRKTASPKRKPS